MYPIMKVHSLLQFAVPAPLDLKLEYEQIFLSSVVNLGACGGIVG
jgi:hypothetical protein